MAADPEAPDPLEGPPRFTRAELEPEPPPAAVWTEVDRAAALAEQLAAGGLELHFEVSAGGGGLAIQMRDRHGNVLREVSPHGALAIASGADPNPG